MWRRSSCTLCNVILSFMVSVSLIPRISFYFFSRRLLHIYATPKEVCGLRKEREKKRSVRLLCSVSEDPASKQACKRTSLKVRSAGCVRACTCGSFLWELFELGHETSRKVAYSSLELKIRHERCMCVLCFSSLEANGTPPTLSLSFPPFISFFTHSLSFESLWS